MSIYWTKKVFEKILRKSTDDMLKDLMDKSYELVLRGFSKKKQKEIIAESLEKGLC